MGNNSLIEERLLDFKHDIRNPLYAAKNLIESHLHYLKASKDDSAAVHLKTKRILSKSARTIEQVIKVIRKLNELSVSPQDSPSSETVCVREILERILEALSGARSLEDLAIVKWVPTDLPLLQVNLIDLEEIFFNLIINASQAMQRGDSLVIEACYRREESSVAISFRDSGCGISKDALPFIFEPFYTRRTEEGGAGFGLYIVRQLIERNGGRISAESKIGVGTIFTLIFPVKAN